MPTQPLKSSPCTAEGVIQLAAWHCLTVVALLIAGRLNVLANVVRKPLRQIFSEFAGAGPEQDTKEYFGTGDVKYHLGTSYDRPTASGKRVHLSLLANPSHLEVGILVLKAHPIDFIRLGLCTNGQRQFWLWMALTVCRSDRSPVLLARA